MKLYVIGIGPGDEKYLTAEAARALDECEVVVGYPLYLDLIENRIRGKELLSTPMRAEAERCRMALDKAAEHRVSALVCGGDAGIYGMAGLVYELAPEYEGVQIEIIPGITAALSGAALLGAPLGHDFAIISLSDLLTPWDTIAARLSHASAGDFAVCLYNPASRNRSNYLAKACDIILQNKSRDTACGIVRNCGRSGEESRIISLGELRDYPADMFTTVFIGNSATRIINGKMVAPRGYRHD